jgi:hypothetical protein
MSAGGDILQPEMPERRAVGGFPLAGTAVAGVVLGHWLTYVLAVTDPHVRAEVLAASGHSYWVLAVKVAVVLVFAALGTVLLRHLGGRSRPEETAEEPFSWIAARLSVLQVVAFAAMEVTERLVVGAPIAHMLHHHLFLMGVAVQLLVACAGGLVLLWFSRAADRVADALGRPRLPRQAAVQTVRIEFQTASPVDPVGGGVGLRGPPKPLIEGARSPHPA